MPMKHQAWRVDRGREFRERSHLFLIALMAWAFTCARVLGGQEGPDPSGPSGHKSLTGRIEAVFATPGFQFGHWGILVVDRKTGQTIYERDPDQFFAPASVTKVFSTAAALVELGPNHRFQTPLVRRGEIEPKGTLRGDVILIAQGDLAMGGRTGPDGTLVFKDDDHTYAQGNLNSQVVSTDPLAALDHIAREVQAAGIREITGDVIVDDRLFDLAQATGSGPSVVSPILINDNVIDVLAQPAITAGEPALVTFQPATQFVTMDAQVATIAAGGAPAVEVHRVGPGRLAVRGQLPVGHARVVKILAVDQPGSFARALLIEALRRHGVQIASSNLDRNVTDGLPPQSEVARLPKVAQYTSPPFSEYIRVTLKVSHNLYASTLPLLLAVRHGERTLAAGLRRQGTILRSLGIVPNTVSFGGGAGGDRADLATPRATVTLLRALAARPEFAAFDAALPVLGRDGTLAKAVANDSPARGHAHAKTGTFSVVNGLDGKALLTSKALAGYLETASGRSLVFAAFVNNVPLDAPRPDRPLSEATAAAGRLMGRLCEALYSDSGDPAGRTTEANTQPLKKSAASRD
jgi:D-alanyl-D-alanine carboxypeptidase/D-alanyl-D-alanine-endopeptidase (penicillin-binding protein 4)